MSIRHLIHIEQFRTFAVLQLKSLIDRLAINLVRFYKISSEIY